MSQMMDFCTWLLPNIADFLLTPPISAFTGVALSFWVLGLIRRLLFLRDSRY